jgi:predicted esterase
MPSTTQPTEHHLAVTRTARYFTLGDPARAKHIWFALHGYGQLASSFIGYLATLDNGSRLIVAPEALSRFYLDQGRGPPGASWMTKEDREHEIADYVRYLDQVSTEVRASAPSDARSYVLGFSQGVATQGRWLDRGSARHDGFCFWAGTLPQELQLSGSHPGLAGRRVALVVGHRDDYLTSDWLETESRRLEPVAGEVRRFPFHGGHRLDRTVLAGVAAYLEGDSTPITPAS